MSTFLDKLSASVREMDEIRRGERVASRQFRIDPMVSAGPSDMESAPPAKRPEASFGFALKFALKFFGLTLLLSIIPLLFVNLPLAMSLIDFGKVSILLIPIANVLAVVLCAALSAKLIFAWGVNGCEFYIAKVDGESGSA